MHEYSEEVQQTFQEIVRRVEAQLISPRALHAIPTSAEFDTQIPMKILEDARPAIDVLTLWSSLLEPATLPVSHSNNLAFIPGAPTKEALLFDMLVSATSPIASTWVDGAGAIWAENQALRWLADLVGFPEGAGGVFVPGATVGTLSALVTARESAATSVKTRHAWRIVVGPNGHSSVRSAARVLGASLTVTDGDDTGRMTARHLAAALDRGPRAPRAVVATAGSTNSGAIDDLSGIAIVCRERGIWLHVDAAFGGAALLLPELAQRFDGIDEASSIVVDPHKWFFAGYDCCALIYSNPERARATHMQRASYLETINEDPEWNPADYASHLTRRARGLPFWFSLMVNGVGRYRDAVRCGVQLAQEAAHQIERRPYLGLIGEPQLSVVLFQRLGWDRHAYERWWRTALENDIAFVQPTTWRGGPAARLCFVNPTTSQASIARVLDAMA